MLGEIFEPRDIGRGALEHSRKGTGPLRRTTRGLAPGTPLEEGGAPVRRHFRAPRLLTSVTRYYATSSSPPVRSYHAHVSRSDVL
jgi:hypothetical protein